MARRRGPYAPPPTGVFAQPIGPVGLDRAKEAADAKRRRAEAAPPGPTVPGVRKLPVAQTHAQRLTVLRQARQVTRQARAKGIDVNDAARNGDAVTRDFFEKAARAFADETKDQQVRVGLHHVRTNPTAYGVKPQQAEKLHKLADEGKIPQQVRDQLAAVGERVGRRLRSEAKPGKAPRRAGFGPASINLTSLSRNLMGVTSLQAPSAENQFFKAAAGDIAALGSAPIIGGWEASQALLEAAKGVPGLREVLETANKAPVVGPLIPEGSGTARGQRLAKGVAEGLRHSVPGELVTGNPQAAAESFRQHPVFGLLDTAGAAGVVGRGLGAVARGVGSTTEAAGLRGTAARIGSTVRPPIAIMDEPGSPWVRRDFSKDTVRKAAQVVADQAREPVRDAQGRVVMVKDRGRNVPLMAPLPHERGAVPGKASLGEKRADFLTARANATERLAREQAGSDIDAAGGKVGKRGAQIVSMVVQGVLRPKTLIADVDKRIETIAGHLADHERRVAAGKPSIYRHGDEVKQAREELAALRAFRESPRAQAQVSAVVARGQAQGRALNAAEREANRLKVLEPEARRAALMPYAQSHMGAVHHSVEDHARLERAAVATEREARARVDELPKGPERARALEEWRKARRDRIEVSGRDPGLVQRHEAARTHAGVARRAHEKAERNVARLQASRQRLLGAQASRRGRRMAEGGGVATAAEKRKLAKIDALLKDAKAQERAARTERTAREKEAASTKMPPATAALRTADGRFLSDAEIERHMRDAGVDPEAVAFLSHRELGNSAYHSRFDPNTRPNLAGSERRTGAAQARGTAGFGPEQVAAEAARKATRNAKAEEIDRMLHSEALRHPAVSKDAAELTAHERRVVEQGGYFTPREAAEIIERTKADRGQDLVAVRAFSGQLSRETQESIRRLQDPRAIEAFPGQLINDRILTLGEARTVKRRQARNVLLMDAKTMNRIQKQLTPAGEIERMAQALNVPFRVSVLAQPRWLTGNFVEPFLIRLPAAGSGLINVPGLANDIRIATKAMRQMERSSDPAVRATAREIRAQQWGGLFIGGRGASVRRRAKDSDNVLAQKAAIVRDLPVVKQLGDLLTAIPQAYFLVNRRGIEQWAQRAAQGRSLRKDMQEITGSWAKAMVSGRAALQDAIDGQVGTAAQHKFMRDQHELLGKYEGYGPIPRKLIQTIAPFLPWALSSARFVWWTMPAHHTALTAMLLKSQQVVSQEWEDQHRDAPPGGLKLAARNPDGSFTDFARYGPYGLSGPIVSGEPQGITDQFFPQLSGAVAAIEGQDPFGRPLQVPKDADHPDGKPGTLGRFAIAAYGLVEALAGPYPALARRLQEQGQTSYSNSTFLSPKSKPDTGHGMSAVQRTLDPFRPTYLRKGGGGGGGLATSGEGGLDDVDLQELRDAARDAADSGLDEVDREELRDLVRGR